MRVFTDFHHSSLMRSLVLLFEGRLDAKIYRPIGLEWFNEGFWAVYNHPDTVKQFLSLDQAFQPVDGTPPLNTLLEEQDGVYHVYDPGMKTSHKACTLDFFKNNQFDYVVASIPQHVPLYERLIAQYQPNAKLIVQMGNNWNIDRYKGYNVLASIAPQPTRANACFYHQEFDLNIFHDTPVQPTRKVYSFINVIEQMGIAWSDYKDLKRMLERGGWEVRAYGGQCPDGSMEGPDQLASKMREAAFIFHVKPGGDGFGHIIHNAYAVGRPIITRPSHYRGQLAEQLLVPGTFIDLDRYSGPEVKNILTRLIYDPDSLEQMGKAAAQRFDDVVNYEKEARGIKQWLSSL